MMIRLLSAAVALSTLITLCPTPVTAGKSKSTKGSKGDTPPSFETLLFLVGEDCAKLASALPGKTVFGPTDEAFEEFLEDTGFDVDTLCGDAVGDLTEILLYHVVDGLISAEEVLALPDKYTRVETLQGSEIKINNDKLTVNGVDIVLPDALTGDFVLHGIDEVLELDSDD
jgi:uncharacterized surface protein with fasciclin (FAS1) repeats